MQQCLEHVDLFIEDANGAKQPVPIFRRDDGLLEIVHSPGFVEGIAAGDVVRLIDEKTGVFEIVARGGNVAVKLIHEEAIVPVDAWLTPRMEALGGWRDGGIARGAVYTVPVTAGFAAIEDVVNRAVAEFPGTSWYYGNVYDEQDRPLNWWR